jgi:hypothetical protein
MLTQLFGGLMAEPVQEKRGTRRFTLHLPLQVTYSTADETQEVNEQHKMARTRDVSARGICFYLDSALVPEAPIEFTLELPAEITLTEGIRVHCKGKVVRVEKRDPAGKVAIAAIIEDYEFQPQPAPEAGK